MALFKRKDNPTVSDIESYYEQQNRRSNSRGRAWAMAILALIVGILFLVLLFFAGRWVYNEFIADDSSTDTSQDVNSGSVSEDGFDSSNSDTSADGASESDSSTDDTDSDGRVSDEAATTDESNAGRIASGSSGSTEDSGSDDDEDSSSNGAVAGSSTEIPNTGPGETALAIALLFGAIATAVSYKKRLN